MEPHEGGGCVRPGHRYNNIHIENSRVHLGDSHGAQTAPPKGVDNCRNDLFLTDHIVDREAFKSEKGQRAEGTCEWIRENDAYKAWLAGNTRRLWISGGPGKGKTMLSIFLTEELEFLVQNKDDTELLFHFCTYQNDKRNNATSVFRSLAYQLLSKRKGLFRHIASYFESAERTKMTLSSAEALWMVLRTLLRAPEAGMVFCLIDGLDECDKVSQQLVTSKFHEFLSSEQTEPGFALAIVSRPIRGLGAFDQVKLDPDNDEYVESDIRQFISTRVRLLEAPGLDESKRRKVEEALLRRAQGTFLWVGFVMRELSSKATCMEIMETLDVLPSGLPGIYARMLLQIDPRKRPVISRILRWATLALRHLTLKEMAAALEIPPAPNLDVNQTISDYLTLCGPMVVVEKTEVRLVHQSARDYLLRSQADNDPTLEMFRVREAEAHAEIMTACLDYLERGPWYKARMKMTTTEFWTVEESMSLFYSYAVESWPYHAKKSRTSLDWGVQLQRVIFRKWDITQRLTGLSTSYYPASLVLHFACEFGIQELVRELLRKKRRGLAFRKPVDKKNGRGESSLFYAARENEKAIAQLLLEHSANINAKDKFERTPISCAIRNGYRAMVQLLLDNGAKLNVKAWDGGPLIAAAINTGDVALVQLLRERGATLRAKRSFELIKEPTEQLLPMMEYLFEDGADANCPNLVMQAAHRGQVPVLRWLFEHGAQTRFEGDESLLEQIMAYPISDHPFELETTQVLLDHGADVNKKSRYGPPPLEAALSRGNLAVVKLLLERGAKLEPSDGITLLDKSILSYNAAAARILLEWGVDPRALAKHTATLEHVVRNGDVDMVELFIDYGTYANITDNGEMLMQETLQNKGKVSKGGKPSQP